MPPSQPRPAIEALLFASDQPLTLPLLSDALEMEAEAVQAELAGLAADYRERGAGVELREIAGGWVFVTAPEHGEAVARMLRGKRRMRLSRAALESLAIIAYKQPVTKSEVEAIRGVDASGVLATLLERNLVTVKGRSQVVGRPLLYGTTPEFLNYFGLKDLAELPRPEELRALVAAREPEQLEMMELDPASGLPLTATGDEMAALAEGAARVAEAGSAEAPADAPAGEPDAAVATASEDDELAEADAALAELDELGGEVAGVSDDRALASDTDDEDDDDFDEDEDEDEFEDDDDEDWDDDLDDEDDADDADAIGDEDEDRPGAHVHESDSER